jgi:hypothetical protein
MEKLGTFLPDGLNMKHGFDPDKVDRTNLKRRVCKELDFVKKKDTVIKIKKAMREIEDAEKSRQQKVLSGSGVGVAPGAVGAAAAAPTAAKDEEPNMGSD